MKSFPGKFASVRGWALLLTLLLGAGILVSACGDEEVPAPTTPTPAPAPAPEPPPAPEPTGPAVPTGLMMSASTATSITWSWNAVEGALGYQGQFSPDAEFTASDPTFLIVAPNTSYTVQNLASNTTGYFRVRSGAGTSLTDLTYSDYTEAQSGTTGAPPPAVPLSAPTGISGSDRQRDSITVTWEEVDAADTYEVAQRAGGGDWTAAACGDSGVVSTNECIATGLTSGTAYDFRVRALPASSDDTKATSAWSSTVSVETTGPAPATPITVTGGVGLRWKSDANSITWDWDQVADRAERDRIDHLVALRNRTNAECPKLVYPGDDVATGLPDNIADNTSVVWINYGKKIAAERSDSTAGNAYLLCVVRTWEDERSDGTKERRFGEVEKVWAATPPEVPTIPTTDAELTTANRTTSELRWDVKKDRGFRYRVGALSFPGGQESTTAKCEDSDLLGDATLTEPKNRDDIADTHRWKNPPAYTRNHLCIRAENDDGMSSWTKSTAARGTLPGKPNLAFERVNSAGTAIVFDFADADSLPTNEQHYSVTTFFSTASISSTDSKKYCAADPNTVPSTWSTASRASTGSTPARKGLSDGIEVTYTHGATQARSSAPDISALGDRSSVYFYMCVAAHRLNTDGAVNGAESGRGDWAVASKAISKQDLPN